MSPHLSCAALHLITFIALQSVVFSDFNAEWSCGYHKFNVSVNDKVPNLQLSSSVMVMIMVDDNNMEYGSITYL